MSVKTQEIKDITFEDFQSDVLRDYQIACESRETSLMGSREVLSGKGSFGILICGSGMGMAIAANKTKNVRAALCYSKKNTQLSRLHNNANIITLGERLIDKNNAFSLIKIFLSTKFEGGRHLRRIKKI